MTDDFARSFLRTSAAIEDGIAKGLHLGVQFYVSRSGQVLIDAAVGEAQAGEPLTTDHVMLLLSAGKPLTAVGVAQLVERGLLSLDDPVAKHISEFAVGGKESVRVRHLLTHTAGNRSVETGWPEVAWAETIRRICESPLESEWVPGQRASYDVAASWFILGELIQRLDGRRFDQYLREAICEPLGLRNLGNGLPEELAISDRARIAPCFVSETGGELHPWEISDVRYVSRSAPGGNTRGSARELGQFYESLMGWRTGFAEVLSPTTVTEMTRRHRVGLFDEALRHVVDFGLGFIVNSRQYGPTTVPYGFGPLASDATFGHGGSQSSIAFADPERKLVVVVVCNGRPGEGRHQRRMRLILDALEHDLATKTGG